MSVVIFAIAATPKKPYANAEQPKDSEVSQNQHITIRGNVYDAQTKKGIAFVKVGVVGTSVETTTDDSGFFSIEVTGKSKKFTLHFDKEGYDIGRKTVHFGIVSPTQVEIYLEKASSISSREPHTKTLRLTGNVYDYKAKKPLSFAVVSVVGMTIRETTDDSGLFVLKLTAAKSAITLNASKEGYASIQRKVDLVENMEPIEIFLHPQEEHQ